MDSVEKASDYQRNFGFVKLEWQIKNYFTRTGANVWVIESPVFSVRGSEITKWCLILTARRLKGRYSASVCLQRSEDDKCPCTVRVNWKLFYPCGGMNHITYSCEGTSDFDRGTITGMEIEKFDLLESRIYSSGSNTFVVHCWMIVYSKESGTFPRPRDAGLKSLSQDMCVVYKLQTHWDSVISAQGEEIPAHMGLLCCRNKEFALDLSDVNRGVEFPFLDPQAVKKVLGYLYTGNLGYVLRTPSFLIHDCIQFMNVQELEEYYTHDELILCSDIEEREYTFNWTINGVLEESKKCITSSLFGKKYLDMTFRLHLYTMGIDGKNEYMSIFVEAVDGNWPDYLFCEFATADIKEGFKNFRRIRWNLRNTKIIGCDRFISTVDELGKKDLLYYGMLNILCIIRLPAGYRNRFVVSSKTSYSVSPTTETYYERLSNQISLLFETGKYSDITIQCGETTFNVHKFVLSGRSHILKEMVSGAVDSCKTSISICDIEPDILRLVLVYLYSGKLKSSDVSVVIKIYTVAERFCILPLKYECSSILQRNIDLQNISEYMALADKCKDYKLRVLTFNFVCNNLETATRKVAESSVTLSQKLAMDFVRYLKNYSNRSSDEHFKNFIKIILDSLKTYTG